MTSAKNQQIIFGNIGEDTISPYIVIHNKPTIINRQLQIIHTKQHISSSSLIIPHHFTNIIYLLQNFLLIYYNILKNPSKLRTPHSTLHHIKCSEGLLEFTVTRIIKPPLLPFHIVDIF